MTLPGWTADASVRRASDYRGEADVASGSSPKGIVPAGSITLGWGSDCSGCLAEAVGLPCWCMWTS
jgi:hypothetical protein